MSKMRIKTGDTVVVRTGKDKGKSGKVLSVDFENQTVVVDGVNASKKHSRPNLANQAGGIIEINRPIHVSNLGIADAKSKAKRVAYKIDSKGTKKRVIAGTDKEIK